MSLSEKFRVVKTTLGVPSIQFIENGEIMHAPVGPWQEAWELYLKPMDLVGRLNNGELEPLVVFDVGLGAATNAIAAISAWTPTGRNLKVISFEKDLDLLRFTLENYQEFPFLKAWLPAIRSLLENGYWQSPDGKITWEPRYGDFTESIKQEKEIAELIFFEPYSPKVNPEMWSLECFKQLFVRTRKKGAGGLLATYSRATSVRAALLLGGFYVGHGGQVGIKEETTIASTRKELLTSPLETRWLNRWQRSHVPFPEGTSQETWPELVKAIMSHPQF